MNTEDVCGFCGKEEHIPNEETLAAMRDVESGEGLTIFSSVEEMLKSLKGDED